MLHTRMVVQRNLFFTGNADDIGILTHVEAIHLAVPIVLKQFNGFDVLH